jgi:hypothetical protein
LTLAFPTATTSEPRRRTRPAPVTQPSPLADGPQPARWTYGQTLIDDRLYTWRAEVGEAPPTVGQLLLLCADIQEASPRARAAHLRRLEQYGNRSH